MADFERTFLAIVGPPGTGKSTLAALVAKATSIRHVDIDDNVRTLYFGKPRANDGTNSEIERLDRLEMAGSYDIFFGIIEGFFHAEKPLIATCTLSSEKHGQRRLEALFQRYPAVRQRIVWLRPRLTDKELQARIDGRIALGYTGATSSVARVRELEKRYEPIVLPHLELNTGDKSTAVCAEEILQYARRHQLHDYAEICP